MKSAVRLFSRRGPTGLRALNQYLGLWSRPDCLLCGASRQAGDGAGICGGCRHALPVMGSDSCPQCAAISRDGRLCGACLSNPPTFSAAVAAFHYAFPVAQVISQLKYGSRLALSAWLGDSLAEVARPRASGVDVVMPLPLSRERIAERGFNQSGLLAERVCRKLGLPMEIDALQRIRNTPPQASLDHEARIKNMRGAFRCDEQDGRFEGMTVALVDDVMTTGATMDSAARALRAVGVARVEAWVVTRTDHAHVPASASPSNDEDAARV